MNKDHFYGAVVTILLLGASYVVYLVAQVQNKEIEIRTHCLRSMYYAIALPKDQDAENEMISACDAYFYPAKHFTTEQP